MAEITTKRTGELLRGVFKILDSKPDGLPARTIFAELERLVPPTQFEQSCYERWPDTRRYEHIVRFSTIGSVKAGWLTKSKGTWSLTEEGRRAYRKHKDPEALRREQARLYKQWELEQPGSDDVAGSEVLSITPSETRTALEEAEETSWEDLERHLGSMNPYDFQNLVAGLLEAMGYHILWTAPPGKDNGFDILAHTDPLGIQGPRIKVQVRRRVEKASVDAIRAFMAVLADGDVGIFVSTGGFTKDAHDEARLQEKRRVTLLDLEKLFDLWVEHNSKIPDKAKQLLLLRPVYYLAPAEP